jgi:hypothetical protein
MLTASIAKSLGAGRTRRHPFGPLRRFRLQESTAH